jgi:branched-chain amino acid aminotransferase
MRARIVYFNGRFVPESEARVSIYDSGLMLGDMAFEVTRTIRHAPYRLGEHIERLFATLTALGIDLALSRGALEEITLETLVRNLPLGDADTDWQIIHNCSRGPVSAYRAAFAAEALRPTVVVSCFPLVEKLGRLARAYDSGLDLVVPRQRAIPADLLDPRLKTRSRLHYQLANLQAEAIQPGATVVLVDTDGYLTEGTSGNLFLVRDGRLATPAGPNLLPGVTRGVVLEIGRRLGLAPEETRLGLSDALEATEMFLTSTSIGILHARAFEGRVLGGGGLGPVTSRLRNALFAELGLDLAAQAARYAQVLAAP